MHIIARTAAAAACMLACADAFVPPAVSGGFKHGLHSRRSVRGAAMQHESSVSGVSRRNAVLAGISLAGSSMVPPLRALAEPVADEIKDYKLVQIFQECKDLGVVRFLSVNPNGAVLEALGKFDYSFVPFEIPGKGQYVRIAGPNSPDHLVATFECSINLDNAAILAFDKLYGPTGELYSLRIMNDKEDKILSILLNYDIEGNGGKPGKYYKGAVEKWEELRKKYADANGEVKLK